ncbi:hypothetical protein [Actinocrispum sp. NPDC049592]|uniref:hypothetical protein n=1 Tax=Actinocrispum sp. NPDC049592 TaxID=3154835 RepID=UPI00343357B9
MQCAVHRPFPLLSWAAVPLLFIAAVLGLTSVGEFLLALPTDTTVTSAHFGAAAGVTVVIGFSMDWPSPRWRGTRWVYAVVILGIGVALHGVVVPGVVAMAMGLPSSAILARISWVHRFSKETRRATPVG